MINRLSAQSSSAPPRIPSSQAKFDIQVMSIIARVKVLGGWLSETNRGSGRKIDCYKIPKTRGWWF